MTKCVVVVAALVLFCVKGASGGMGNNQQTAPAGLGNAASREPVPVTMTYASLKALADSRALAAGQKYRIVDFRTRHTIPYTKHTNEGPTEVLVATAVTASALAPVVCSEMYPQDVMEYELVNSSNDPAVDRGRITYRRDTRKEISAHEDWRSVKYRRGLNRATGRFTELDNFSEGYVDRYPFNNSSDPAFFNRVHVGTANDSPLSNIVIGTGASQGTYDIIVGPGNIDMTIGDNSNIIEIAQANGSISIGNYSHHIRIGACSDFTKIGDWCCYINVGTQSSQITINDYVQHCTVGDNVMPLTIGSGSALAGGTTLSDVYVGHGVYIDPPPQIIASGTLEKHMSTIPAVVDITGQSTLDLAKFKYAGIISLTSKNASESLRVLLKKVDPNGNDFPIELRPSAGLQLAVTGSAVESLAADGLIVTKGAVHLNGDKGDAITLKRKKIGAYSVFVEVSRSVF
jgi:hypothetical protein